MPAYADWNMDNKQTQHWPVLSLLIACAELNTFWIFKMEV